MTEPILCPNYWKRRLQSAPPGQPHHAVFRCPLERWQRIEAAHRRLLARHVGPSDSVLDAGCGWGRLLDLMPPGWSGDYLGVDLSPDFIDLAKILHRGRHFAVGDLRDLSAFEGRAFDWAVLVSVRPMVRRNLGDGAWAQMEREVRRLARRVLYLEYDPEDEGDVE